VAGNHKQWLPFLFTSQLPGPLRPAIEGLESYSSPASAVRPCTPELLADFGLGIMYSADVFTSTDFLKKRAIVQVIASLKVLPYDCTIPGLLPIDGSR